MPEPVTHVSQPLMVNDFLADASASSSFPPATQPSYVLQAINRVKSSAENLLHQLTSGTARAKDEGYRRLSTEHDSIALSDILVHRTPNHQRAETSTGAQTAATPPRTVYYTPSTGTKLCALVASVIVGTTIVVLVQKAVPLFLAQGGDPIV